MTKQEVLQDIDKLCGGLDKWLHMKADALDEGDIHNVVVANNKISRIAIEALQELSFLRDYINENIKEE